MYLNVAEGEELSLHQMNGFSVTISIRSCVNLAEPAVALLQLPVKSCGLKK